jgi:hypothetical protein
MRPSNSRSRSGLRALARARAELGAGDAADHQHQGEHGIDEMIGDRHAARSRKPW